MFNLGFTNLIEKKTNKMKQIISTLLVALCISFVVGVHEDFARHLWNKFKKTHGKQKFLIIFR